MEAFHDWSRRSEAWLDQDYALMTDNTGWRVVLERADLVIWSRRCAWPVEFQLEISVRYMLGCQRDLLRCARLATLEGLTKYQRNIFRHLCGGVLRRFA